MPTVFTQIIEGALPGRFVWEDSECVAFLTIAPIRRGHVLVVPRREIDHWLDAPPELAHHLMDVAGQIGRAISTVYQPTKVGLMIAGLEVPHLHIHVLPIDDLGDLDFSNATAGIGSELLDDDQRRIKEQLELAGK